MGKHAYLMVVNSNMKVLKKCLESIDDSRNDVYIMVDKKSKKLDEVQKLITDTLKHVPVFVTCEQIVNWGGVLADRSSVKTDLYGQSFWNRV